MEIPIRGGWASGHCRTWTSTFGRAHWLRFEEEEDSVLFRTNLSDSPTSTLAVEDSAVFGLAGHGTAAEDSELQSPYTRLAGRVDGHLRDFD